MACMFVTRIKDRIPFSNRKIQYILRSSIREVTEGTRGPVLLDQRLLSANSEWPSRPLLPWAGEIDGKGRTVRELLSGRKYSIDYYQREYKWQKKHIEELLDDLSTKFLESHEKKNERTLGLDLGSDDDGSLVVALTTYFG